MIGRLGASASGRVDGDPEQDRHGDDEEGGAGAGAVHPSHHPDEARSPIWAQSGNRGNVRRGGFT